MNSNILLTISNLAWICPCIIVAQSVKGYPDEIDIPLNRKCNDTSCVPSKPYWLEDDVGDKAAPPGVNDKTHAADDRNRHPYERDGKYWLVPPFLIGACSVIVLYIFVHCIYLHCYAKKKMRKLATTRQYPPAIVISDDPTSTNSYQPYTPIVKYEGAYGQTEIHPFLLCHPFDDNEWERQLEQRRRSSVRSSIRKKSFSLQIPKLFGKQRPSVCSAGAVLEPSSSASDQETPKLDSRRPTRASICFVPVGRTLSEPSGAPTDWSQLPGFMFPSVVMPTNVPDGVTSSGSPGVSSDGEGQPPLPTSQPTPIIVIRRPSTQINLPPGATVLGTQPPAPASPAPPSTSAPTTGTPTPNTGTPATNSSVLSSASSSSVASTTAATIHAEPSAKVNGLSKPEVQVTFHIEDCDSGQGGEIPLEEIKEETHES